MQTLTNFLNENYLWFLYNSVGNVTKGFYEATELVLSFVRLENGEAGDYIGKTIKLPKKSSNLTIEWILSKVESDKIYQNFATEFKKLLIKEYQVNLNVYPTSYGIGIDTFNYMGFFNENKAKVEQILVKLRVLFTTEYSSASLVYRFKISKSKENIEKLKLINS
jgi:hypothetical protein